MAYTKGQIIQDPKDPTLSYEVLDVGDQVDGFKTITHRLIQRSTYDPIAAHKAKWGVEANERQRGQLGGVRNDVDYGGTFVKLMAPNGNFVDMRGFGVSSDFFTAPNYLNFESTLQQARHNLRDDSGPQQLQFQADARRTLLDRTNNTGLSAGNAANFDLGARVAGTGASSTGTGQPPNPSNPWFGIPSNISSGFTTNQQAIDYWKTGGTGTGGTGGSSAYTIPYKPGLSQQQQDSISLLAQKSSASWSQADKDNWNFATNNAPPPPPPTGGPAGPGGPGGPGGPAGPGGPGGPTSTGNAQMDAILKNLQTYLDTITKSGQRVNPNLEISPEMAAQFLSQATSEIDPYYQNLYKVIEGDVQSKLKDMQETYVRQKETLGADFQKSLGDSREAAAGRGTFFSGGRVQQENLQSAATQRSIDSAAQAAASNVGNLLRDSESKIGTTRTLNLGSPSITAPTADRISGGLTGGRTLDVFSGLSVPGSVEAQRQTAIQGGVSRKEQAERINRGITFYGS